MRHGRRCGPRVDGPAGRSFTAMHTSEKDRSWLAPDAEFMTAGQITIEPVEHKRAPAVDVWAATRWQTAGRRPIIFGRLTEFSIHSMICVMQASTDGREEWNGFDVGTLTVAHHGTSATLL